MGGKFHLKLNISRRPIANKYCEGKMKRRSKGLLKGLEIAEREGKGANANRAVAVGRPSRKAECVSVGSRGGIAGSGGSGLPCLTLSCAAARTEGKCLRTLTNALSSTRLETRTKESNIYASARVANPCAE